MTEIIKYADGSTVEVVRYLFTTDICVGDNCQGIGVDLGTKSAAMSKAREVTRDWLISGHISADVVGVCEEGIARRIWNYANGEIAERIDP